MTLRKYCFTLLSLTHISHKLHRLCPLLILQITVILPSLLLASDGSGPGNPIPGEAINQLIFPGKLSAGRQQEGEIPVTQWEHPNRQGCQPCLDPRSSLGLWLPEPRSFFSSFTPILNLLKTIYWGRYCGNVTQPVMQPPATRACYMGAGSLAVPLPIQFCASISWKAVVDSPNIWAVPLRWNLKEKLLGFGLAKP